MNGRFLLDTNAVIGLLDQRPSLLSLLRSAAWVGINIITELEFLSFSELSEADKILFERFKTRVEVVNLNASDTNLIQFICEIRQKSRLKLPDAIIAGSALYCNATLITNDAAFSKVAWLTTQPF